MEPVITLWRAGDVPALWTDLIAARFAREFHGPMAHTAPAEWRVLVTAGDDLIGHAGILRRTATVAGRPIRLGGIGAVIIEPAWRGRGLGGAAVRRAGAFLQEETDAAFGYLLCAERRVAFYASLGWQEQTGPAVFTDWQGRRTQNILSSMVLPLRGQPWPPGEVDLRGLPW